jgi:hypothetical protein
MLSEDQYLERTPDIVTKVRKLREAAAKEMNRFTRVADYDVRRVVGRKPKETPLRNAHQLVMEIPPAPAEHGNDVEGA